MAYSIEQIEKGRYRNCTPKGSKKLFKKSLHRKTRQKMKDLEYVPKDNRYKGWEL